MSKWLFKAKLRGSHEVPSVETDARGLALLKFKRHNNHLKLAYLVKIRDIESLRKIDLHLGRRGQVGPVVATLYGPTTPGISVSRGKVFGVLRSSDLVGPLRGHSLIKLLKLILKGKIYVNVHTTEHPRGEIRGQVHKKHRHHCGCNEA
ncbi:CHRD domain-containing protein [Paenibacillus septentrionalis]|uniref:CHRD domain-containing protein n=1 Tax=Paenibacillus septentrionalis TaxID=429342 RepID=A0ABW1V7R2_9BACL